MICSSCGQDREFLENGICLICKRANKQGIEVEHTTIILEKGIEIPSKTGQIDENIWMRK